MSKVSALIETLGHEHKLIVEGVFERLHFTVLLAEGLVLSVESEIALLILLMRVPVAFPGLALSKLHLQFFILNHEVLELLLRRVKHFRLEELDFFILLFDHEEDPLASELIFLALLVHHLVKQLLEVALIHLLVHELLEGFIKQRVLLGEVLHSLLQNAVLLLNEFVRAGLVAEGVEVLLEGVLEPWRALSSLSFGITWL